MRPCNFSFLLLALTLSAGPVYADTVTWATWNAPTSTGASGSDTGTINGVGVTFNGEIDFANQSGVGALNYFAPTSTYTSAAVSNMSANGGIIAISGNSSNSYTFTFASPVTNLVLSEVSLGGGTMPVSYNFDEAFQILSCGPNGIFGGGCFTQNGNTLTGTEGDGTIEFAGTISSLSFTTTGHEAGGGSWNGFTIGTPDQINPNPVPEPATLALMSTGILGLAAAWRCKIGRVG
jgi:hypothetical protein